MFDGGVGSWYAGIGSRETPGNIRELMWLMAFDLGQNGWGIRTGGAPGADSAFLNGARLTDGPIELYLPWPGFEGYEVGGRIGGRDHPTKDAYTLAAEHHPAWLALKQGAKALHARNCHQICGIDVTNPELSTFVLCWTPRAEGGGGTGQAIRLAKHFNVPVYDLADPRIEQRITNYLMKEEEVTLL